VPVAQTMYKWFVGAPDLCLEFYQTLAPFSTPTPPPSPFHVLTPLDSIEQQQASALHVQGAQEGGAAVDAAHPPAGGGGERHLGAGQGHRGGAAGGGGGKSTRPSRTRFPTCRWGGPPPLPACVSYSVMLCRAVQLLLYFPVCLPSLFLRDCQLLAVGPPTVKPHC